MQPDAKDVNALGKLVCVAPASQIEKGPISKRVYPTGGSSGTLVVSGEVREEKFCANKQNGVRFMGPFRLNRDRATLP